MHQAAASSSKLTYYMCVCDVVERVVSIEQQTAHTKSIEQATAKGMCISTDYELAYGAVASLVPASNSLIRRKACSYRAL